MFFHGLVLFVGLALASHLKLLQPTDKTVWTSGTDVEVFWKFEGQAAEGRVKTLEFDLMQGRNRRPELVDNLAIGVSWNSDDVLWTVNEKLPTGDDYFVRVSSPDDPDFRYDSPFFSIQQKPRSKRISGSCSSNSARSAMAKPCLGLATLLAALFLSLF